MFIGSILCKKDVIYNSYTKYFLSTIIAYFKYNSKK